MLVVLAERCTSVLVVEVDALVHYMLGSWMGCSWRAFEVSER